MTRFGSILCELLGRYPDKISIYKRSYQKLTTDTINPNVVKLQYAVRGPIVIRADELTKKLRSGEKLPFKQIIRCNIGDCHATGQKPLTFLRKVISAASDESLLNASTTPEDVKSRVKKFLESCGGSVGVYSHSNGAESLRINIAEYIKQRDGLSSNPDDIFVCSGASEGVKYLLQLVSTGTSAGKRAGVMIPTPQYPLYSATNAEIDSYGIGYYLDEAKGWSLSRPQLEQAYEEAKDKCLPRVLVVINPGNPTGQLLSRESIEEVIKFAHEKSLMVMADEVYQHNIYTKEKKFVSFKKVLHDMGGSVAKDLQLASFMSVSKGFMGECGLRGGYCELVNFDPGVKAQLYKSLTARLCSSLIGQMAMDTVVCPPKPGEPSYDQFEREKSEVLGALKLKSELVSQTFNQLPGYHCNPIEGAMYAFPRIDLPPKAIKEAEKQKIAPDFMYCSQLLEQQGICVVPGSGFGQMPGTWHFRSLIDMSSMSLPPILFFFLLFQPIEYNCQLQQRQEQSPAIDPSTIIADVQQVLTSATSNSHPSPDVNSSSHKQQRGQDQNPRTSESPIGSIDLLIAMGPIVTNRRVKNHFNIVEEDKQTGI